MTAVEWLEQVLNEKMKLTPVDFFQAKEMEKQQMIEMHDKGFDSVKQLNDDYAIEFAGWLTFNNLFYSIEFGNDKASELLEQFKKEKGL